MLKFDFNDPTRWTFTGAVYLYTGSEETQEIADYVMRDMAELNEVNSNELDFYSYEAAMHLATPDSRFSNKATCDHCGAHFNYGALYTSDTGEVAIVGNICASNQLNLTAHEYADAKLRSVVKAARNKVAANIAVAKLLPNRREVLSGDHYITSSIRGNFRKWHSLSLKQWALLKKIAREEAVKADEKANEPQPVAIPAELADGRHTISGVLLGTKAEPGYGWNSPDIIKMLVRDDRGFKIWCTRPSAIYEINRGDRLSFDAAIQISDRDECFGFAKRPTKATFVAAGAI